MVVWSQYQNRGNFNNTSVAIVTHDANVHDLQQRIVSVADASDRVGGTPGTLRVSGKVAVENRPPQGHLDQRQ